MIQAAPMQNGEEKIQENAYGAAFLNLHRFMHYQSRFRHVIVQYRHLPTGGW